MAHAPLLPDPILRHLADQLGVRLPRALNWKDRKNAKVRLTESFPVWLLDTDAAAGGDRALDNLALRTGRWHHQIWIGDRAAAWARSMPLGSDTASWDIREVYEGALAGRINRAIDWIDKAVDGNPEARLLEIPAYSSHAFWLAAEAGDRVVVIDTPASFHHLKPDTAYPAAAFLKALAQEERSDSNRSTPESPPELKATVGCHKRAEADAQRGDAADGVASLRVGLRPLVTTVLR